MDGMGEYAIVWKVMLPTAIPALLAFAIFSVVAILFSSIINFLF
jgi:multiple sugar transport system permease protein